MNEDIKEKLDLNPNNMNEIAKQAYYQLENYIFTLEKTQNNWNELKKWLEEELKEYQKSKYPSDYGLVLGFIWQMQRKMQELEQGKDE